MAVACPTCGKMQRPDVGKITLLDALAGLCLCKPEQPELCPVHNRDGCDHCFEDKIYSKPKSALVYIRRLMDAFRKDRMKKSGDDKLN